MTCCVGIMADGVAYIAADSARTFESGFSTVRSDDNRGGKIFVNGEYVIAVSGSLRTEQLAHYVFVPPVPLAGPPNMVTMVRDFVPALRHCLDQSQAVLPRRENYTEMMDGMFLVACRGALFEIDDDFQVVQLDNGLYAIGSGSRLAIGALHATHKDGLGPATQLRRALAAAAEYDANVRPPFFVGVCSATTITPAIGRL